MSVEIGGRALKLQIWPNLVAMSEAERGKDLEGLWPPSQVVIELAATELKKHLPLVEVYISKAHSALMDDFNSGLKSETAYYCSETSMHCSMTLADVLAAIHPVRLALYPFPAGDVPPENEDYIVIDFTMGREHTDELLAVKFDKHGDMLEIVVES